MFRVFRSPVAEHDLLTRTDTIQFNSVIYHTRFSLPPLIDRLRRARRLDTCVPTHGDVARLLVGWFEPAGTTVLGSCPSSRAWADTGAASSTGRAADS
jgi:hypothetical protein